MSIFLEVTATCPKCGAETEVDLAASVNADRRPDLRQEILDGSFQAMDCPECGGVLRLPAHLTYIDVGRNQWILVQSADALERWVAEEAEAHGIFEQNFGAAAPEFSREIGADLQPRLVFGWPALREKLIAADLALDDTTLEMLKIQLMRNVPDAPLADETELRLTGGDAGKLDFTWFHRNTEASLSDIAVPRAAYDDLTEQMEDWAPLRANFTGKLFVDLKRLLAGPA
jgi:hypothetical protein